MATSGSILQINPATWVDQIPVERAGTVTTWTSNSIQLDAGASSDAGAYVGMTVAVVKLDNPTFSDAFSSPQSVITAYDPATKVATVSGWNTNPIAGRQWRIVRRYPVLRKWQWKKNGVNIPGAILRMYTPSDSDIGSDLTVEETAWFISATNNGSTLETPTATTVTVSAPVSITAATSPNPKLVRQSHLSYQGSFKFPSTTYDPAAPNRSFPAYSGLGSYVKVNGSTANIVALGHVYEPVAGEFSTTVTPSNGDYNSLQAPAMVYPTSGILPYVSSGVNVNKGSMVETNKGIEYKGLQATSSGEMIFTVRSPYTFSGNPCWIGYKRPANLADQDQSKVKGPFIVYDRTAGLTTRFSMGQYALIPPQVAGDTDWRTVLGGDMLSSGNFTYTSASFNTVASHGPCASVWNSSDIDTALTAYGRKSVISGGTSTSVTLDAGASSVDGYYVNHYIGVDGYNPSGGQPILTYNGTTKVATVAGFTSAPPAGTEYTIIPLIQSKQLVGYRYSAPLEPDSGKGIAFGSLFGLWDWGTSVDGMFIPNGTHSLLVVAKHGVNPYTYGATGAFANGVKKYDPGNPSGNGPATWPYTYRIYAYDLNELAQVAAGTKAFNDVLPYGIYYLNITTSATLSSSSTASACYNPLTKQIYIVEQSGPFSSAVVHVVNVSNAVIPA